MKAVGITCGIGSMLVGAKRAGFDVVGNVEWRKYYHEGQPNTFTENFPGAMFPSSREQMTEEEFRKFSNADIALGHPECGNFSSLANGGDASKRLQERLLDPTDIPLFVNLVAELKPRFFVMDDLPKSFIAYPMKEYAKTLPDYDLFPEWVSNYHYGNVQKGRKRMFMLGSLKKEKWSFRPGEFEHSTTVADVIGDLGPPRRGSNIPNHDPFALHEDCPWGYGLRKRGQKSTWGDVAEFFKGKPGGANLTYVKADGEVGTRIGFYKGHWDGPSHVLTGYHTVLHGQRCEPYSIRERARIQGFPDDFVFYGYKLNDRGEWGIRQDKTMTRQTGKAMPVQFCEYVSKQVAAHVKGQKFTSSGKRYLTKNSYVDEAKKWYCSNVGYADQEKACNSCWLFNECNIRGKK